VTIQQNPLALQKPQQQISGT